MSDNALPRIEFIDLRAQRRRLGRTLDKTLLSVIDEARYILGPQVGRFEAELASFCGAGYAIGTANGTDALGICLMALGLRPGDAVICPGFTFAATAEAVAWLGATPIFADIDAATYNLDAAALPLALATARREKLRVRAVIAVDLFGQPADYDAIETFCRRNELVLICDAAQAIGAAYKGRPVGSIGDFTTASFFPAKPLGCYGDGGVILTDDPEREVLLRSLRFHGKGSEKYDNVRIGMNSRLDTLQATILLEKLSIFEDEIARRQVVAERYSQGLEDVAVTPHVLPGCRSVWAQYTLRVPAERRASFIAGMKDKGIPTNIYYPRPLNRQTAYQRFPVAGDGLPVAEVVSREVVALPMHPYLEEETQAYIIEVARSLLTEASAT